VVGEHGLASPPCCGQAISRGAPVVFAVVAAATPLSTIEVIAGRRRHGARVALLNSLSLLESQNECARRRGRGQGKFEHGASMVASSIRY